MRILESLERARLLLRDSGTTNVPRVEDLLSTEELHEVPDDELMKLIVLERSLRRRKGESPDDADFVRRFPRLAPRLQDLFGPDPDQTTSPFAACDAPTRVVTPGREAPHAASTSSEIADSSPPLRIGRYRVVRTLGEGAFGCVYSGYDETLQRAVAIKVPRPENLGAPEREMLLAEAQKLAALEHPNIVPVYDVGQLPDGSLYMVSKLIDGADLRTLLRVQAVGPARGAEIAATVAEALHHAHRQGFVHRDVKPANILVDRQGKVFVADFGLALRDADSSLNSSVAGTPAYMSPEQASGRSDAVDGRSDIFSLGAVLYELLTGSPPFRGKGLEEIRQRVLSVEPKPPRQIRDDIPEALERICLKCLAKPSAERYSTAKDLARDLRGWNRPAPTPGWSRRVALVAASIALTGIAAFVVWSLMNRGTPGVVPAAEAFVEVQFKPNRDSPHYSVVDAESVPLKTGDLVRLSGRFTPPMFPVVAIGSRDAGKAKARLEIAYPPKDRLHEQRAQAEWLAPSRAQGGDDRWWTLKPPEGTLAFLVLARDRPIADAAEWDRLADRLDRLEDLPDLGPSDLLQFRNGRIDILRDHEPRDRSFGTADDVVTTPGVAIEQLYRDLKPQFPIVQVIAVPQQDG